MSGPTWACRRAGAPTPDLPWGSSECGGRPRRACWSDPPGTQCSRASQRRAAPPHWPRSSCSCLPSETPPGNLPAAELLACLVVHIDVIAGVPQVIRLGHVAVDTTQTGDSSEDAVDGDTRLVLVAQQVVNPL